MKIAELSHIADEALADGHGEAPVLMVDAREVRRVFYEDGALWISDSAGGDDDYCDYCGGIMWPPRFQRR
jgi:hypothetical protein